MRCTPQHGNYEQCWNATQVAESAILPERSSNKRKERQKGHRGRNLFSVFQVELPLQIFYVTIDTTQMMHGFRALHWVLKVGDRTETVEFLHGENLSKNHSFLTSYTSRKAYNVYSRKKQPGGRKANSLMLFT
jgi:hypothetical protein